jgi:hypothetical protein
MQLYEQAELDARVEDDDTAAPRRDSPLGRQYYYLDEIKDVDP